MRRLNEDENVLVLVFPDLETAADAMLALHALRGGDYKVSAFVEGKVKIPEFDPMEILDLETYQERQAQKL